MLAQPCAVSGIVLRPQGSAGKDQQQSQGWDAERNQDHYAQCHKAFSALAGTS
jgi:hypothetical protein